MKNYQGFTLLEVLVALLVLGIALAAVIQSVASQADNTAYLQQKTLAHWVAQNRLAEMQIQGIWAIGEQTDTAEMGAHIWYWRSNIETTPDPDLRRVEIFVTAEEDSKDPLAHLVGFLGQP